MKRSYFVLMFLMISQSCSKEDAAPGGQSVKARVLYRSCAGTVLQWVETPARKGQEWLWFTDLDGPFDQSNPAKTYPGCVSAFDVPTDRQIPNDTLEFTYQELSALPEPTCALGGLPTIYISVKGLKNR